MDLQAVFTTVANQEQADALALPAVEQRLAACVQTQAVHSTYRWQGAGECAADVRLMFKTAREKYGALEELLLKRNPYELPAIFALPVTQASTEYAECLVASVGPANKPT